MHNDYKQTSLIPNLRFPDFKDDWSFKQISEITDRISDLVEVKEDANYREIGIRSHGRGIFHKKPVKGKELGNKRVYWIKNGMFVVNIVFAWEQAIAKTTKDEVGMIASHRFPMYLPKEGELDLDFLLYFFSRKTGKNLLELSSPGGAGRNKTLGQKLFNDLEIKIPLYEEQIKISSFLKNVDSLILSLQNQIDNLYQFRKGLSQQIFNQKINFRSKNSNSSKWLKDQLLFFLKERKEKNKYNKFSEVFSVAKEKGVVNQIEHLGRSYASSDLTSYKIVHPGDVIYTKSPTSNFPYGVIKQNQTGRIGLVSTLYAVYEPMNTNIGYLLQEYFQSSINIFNYLNPLVHKGAKNTINIGNSVFLKGKKISIPRSELEQEQIVNSFKLINRNIDLEKQRLSLLKQWKKGLLQQMFV